MALGRCQGNPAIGGPPPAPCADASDAEVLTHQLQDCGDLRAIDLRGQAAVQEEGAALLLQARQALLQPRQLLRRSHL